MWHGGRGSSVNTVDDRTILCPGPMTTAIAEVYARTVRGEETPVQGAGAEFLVSHDLTRLVHRKRCVTLPTVGAVLCSRARASAGRRHRPSDRRRRDGGRPSRPGLEHDAVGALTVRSRRRRRGDTSTTSIADDVVLRHSWRTIRSRSTRRIPPGSGVPVPGANDGSSDVDVDGDVEVVGPVERFGDGVGHHRLEPALPDLLHVGQRIPARASTRTCRRAASSPAGRPGRSCRPGTAPDSISRRIGVPWLARLPSMMSAVSAWASKWTMPTLPYPWWSATAVAAGHVIEWSPPRMIGTMPRRAISCTRVLMLAWLIPSCRGARARRRSRSPRGGRRSRPRDPCDRCPGRTRWRESPGGRTGRRVGSWCCVERGADDRQSGCQASSSWGRSAAAAFRTSTAHRTRTRAPAAAHPRRQPRPGSSSSLVPVMMTVAHEPQRSPPHPAPRLVAIRARQVPVNLDQGAAPFRRSPTGTLRAPPGRGRRSGDVPIPLRGSCGDRPARSRRGRAPTGWVAVPPTSRVVTVAR